MAGVDLTELADFLVFAKSRTYAGNGKRIVLPDGTKRFEPIISGSWQYEDEYRGRTRFGGRVRVSKDDKPYWHMFYRGGMTQEFKDDPELTRSTYAFLKKALLSGDADSPFRGAATFNEEDFAYYNNTIKGDLADFKGREEIWLKDKQVYVLRFIGGLIEG
ncbi:hypothetical protein KY310_01210 [Candidatus Woesearchaeota archaeon]|nr:hypothetical protein [Candidatus Woesearchaeota archaeon]